MNKIKHLSDKEEKRKFYDRRRSRVWGKVEGQEKKRGRLFERRGVFISPPLKPRPP